MVGITTKNLWIQINYCCQCYVPLLVDFLKDVILCISRAHQRHVDGLVKDFSIFSVLAMEILLSPGLGSIPFIQFNSVIFNSNSNSNSTTHNKFQFQFQFQFQRFQFQFQFQFQRFQIPAISILEMTCWCLPWIDYNYTNKVHVYKIIVINTISLMSLVKWLYSGDPL